MKGYLDFIHGGYDECYLHYSDFIHSLNFFILFVFLGEGALKKISFP